MDPNNPSDYVIINETDFVDGTHELWENGDGAAEDAGPNFGRMKKADLIAELPKYGLSEAAITGTGSGDKVTNADMVKALETAHAAADEDGDGEGDDGESEGDGGEAADE